MYFRHFIVKQGIIFEDVCYRQLAQFCSVCPPSGPSYYGPANWSLRRQGPCAKFAINIIHYYELFSMDAGLNSKGTKAIKMVEK